MVVPQTQISSLPQKWSSTLLVIYCSLIEGVWFLLLQPSIFGLLLLYYIKTVRFFLVQICLKVTSQEKIAHGQVG